MGSDFRTITAREEAALSTYGREKRAVSNLSRKTKEKVCKNLLIRCYFLYELLGLGLLLINARGLS
jgi:hypothetical protein